MVITGERQRCQFSSVSHFDCDYAQLRELVRLEVIEEEQVRR